MRTLFIAVTPLDGSTGPADDTLAAAPAPLPRHRLDEVAGLFLRLGFTAFGGPAAHVAMMEDEVVARRRWLDRQHFLDLVAAVNFVPGPNSTELAIHPGGATYPLRRSPAMWSGQDHDASGLAQRPHV